MKTRIASDTARSSAITIIQQPESVLNDVRIASPCHASWEQMRGDNRVRYCESCQLNVYNLSGMATREAERLVQNSEGRVCLRYYQRQDGTILTQDCPVGLAAARRRLAMALSAAVVLILSLWALLFRQENRIPLRDSLQQLTEDSSGWRAQQPQPVRRILNQLDPDVIVKKRDLLPPVSAPGTPAAGTSPVPAPVPIAPKSLQTIPTAPTPLMGEPAINHPPTTIPKPVSVTVGRISDKASEPQTPVNHLTGIASIAAITPSVPQGIREVTGKPAISSSYTPQPITPLPPTVVHAPAASERAANGTPLVSPSVTTPPQPSTTVPTPDPVAQPDPEHNSSVLPALTPDSHRDLVSLSAASAPPPVDIPAISPEPVSSLIPHHHLLPLQTSSTMGVYIIRHHPQTSVGPAVSTHNKPERKRGSLHLSGSAEKHRASQSE